MGGLLLTIYDDADAAFRLNKNIVYEKNAFLNA